MPQREEPTGISKYYRIIGITALGILLIWISVIGDGWLDSSFFLSHPASKIWLREFLEILTKIGDAAVIAGIIGFGIDVAVKKSLIEEVVRAASPDLLGRHLPTRLRQAVLEMFDVTLVRPEYSVEYVITQHPGVPDILEVESTISGTIKNCGNAQETFNFISSIDASYLHNSPDSKIKRVTIAPEFGTSIVDESPDNSRLIQADGTKLYQYSLPMSPGQTVRTSVNTVEYRPTTYLHPLFTGTTITKILLHVQYPEDVLDLFVSTGTSESMPATKKTGVGQEWDIQTPLLPGQCLLLTWRPKINTPPATAAAASAPSAPPPVTPAPQPTAPVTPPTV